MLMKRIFIIEHLEEKVWKWCLFEYEHISKIVGKNNLWFTNIKSSDAKKLSKFGQVFKQSVKSMALQKTCVLDPEAPKPLLKSDGKFQFFIFGGILGDYPARKRTKEELSSFMPESEKRNLGKEQMATDNAVYVTKQILGGKSSSLKFQEGVTIKINKIESTDLPFKYVQVNGKPLISKKVINYLKNKKGF